MPKYAVELSKNIIVLEERIKNLNTMLEILETRLDRVDDLLATRLDRADDSNRDLSSRLDIIETRHEELKKWKDDIRARSWSLFAPIITGLIVGFILLLGQYLFGSFKK